VENLLPRVRNVTGFAVDIADSRLYWTEKTGNRTGKIQRANLDGTNVQLVKSLRSVPLSIALDTVNRKIYLTNSWGKVQRLNFDGSKFQPNLVRGLKVPKSLAVDVAGGKLYWIEKTGNRTGKIERANLDGTGVQLVKSIKSVPLSIALDTVNRKIYLTNSWGKVQRLNFDGSKFQPNLVRGLKVPKSLAVDVAGGKLYWIEKTGNRTGKIERANLDGTGVQLVKSIKSVPLSIALDTVNRKIYLTNSWGKVQRLNFDGSKFQPNLITGLKAPKGIAVDAESRKLYWTEKGSIRRANLNGKNIKNIVTGLDAPANLTLGILPVNETIASAPATVILAPDETVLHPNYPNPFNPETWIPYHLAEPADVTLHIYAANGVLVRTLALGHQSAGIYRSRSRAAYWDGRNEFGEPVASGIYFNTLSADNFTATRKMIIMK
jgi:sugar lactone lactonase YvrE